jgi:hypothetical protein
VLGSNAYPFIFALAGFVASALLTERALRLMPTDAKAALADSTSGTRLLNLLALGVFFALVLWRPLLSWAFFGCAYLGLGARSLSRLRRLELPPRAARLLLIGNVSAVAGIALCAFIFALRALQ